MDHLVSCLYSLLENLALILTLCVGLLSVCSERLVPESSIIDNLHLRETKSGNYLITLS